VVIVVLALAHGEYAASQDRNPLSRRDIATLNAAAPVGFTDLTLS
jgi:hypothetical protein